jgi:hypothetical protein
MRIAKCANDLELFVMTHQFLSSIEACRSCAAACDALLAGARTDMPAGLRSLLSDCADTCRMTAQFLLADKDPAEVACRACADICGSTASQCEQVQEASFQLCAHAARQCAEECDRVAHGWLGRKKEDPTGGPYAG